jgi:hypothetical protein
MEPDTERDHIEGPLARRFFSAIVARAVYDYRGNDAARSAEAARWLDETVGSTNWRGALAERRGPGRPRKS